MKWAAAALVFALVVLLSMAWLARQSRQMPPPELPADGRLPPCPASPNCVCSEPGTDSAHAVPPLPDNWPGLLAAIRAEGGVVDRDDGRFLRAQFRSPVFGFVDDVLARRDRERGVIQIRSASRVGRSDFGVNRRRVAVIRARMREGG